MVNFSKADLQYEYTWTTVTDDNPDETGTPDRDLLNRFEGYEVLYFINKFMDNNNLKSLFQKSTES